MLERYTVPVGPLACNCSILADTTTAEAVVVDPGAQIELLIQRIEQRDWKLTAILITHAHIDHIGGAAEMRRRTGAPVWFNPRDRALAAMLEEQAMWIGVPPPPQVPLDSELTREAKLMLGGYRLQVLETPGHTEGSVCLYLPEEKLLLAGDTLFAGSIGRTDLPGGDTTSILDSLRGTLMALPDDIKVIPGHGPFTTIGQERQTNPFLQ